MTTIFPSDMNSRNKGATFEREIIKAFRGLPWSLSASGTWSNGDLVVMTLSCRPTGIECKRRKKIAIYEWWEQACKSADAKKMQPIVIVRADHEETLVVMDLREFMRLIREEVSHS